MTPSFRFIGSGLYAGIARDAEHRTTAQCPHGHRTTALAVACATRTLITKETP